MNIRDKITIMQGNIIQQDTDAIVNSANTNLVLGSGVAGAIKAADDGAVQRECDLIGKIRLGDAAITSGGATGIPFIIHAAGMHIGRSATVDSVRTAVRSSLRRACEKELGSIAFPAIGTGIGGLSMESCAALSIEEARNHLAGETTLREIRFVLFLPDAHAVFQDTYDQILPPTG